MQLFEHDSELSLGRAAERLAEHEHRRMALADLRKDAPSRFRFPVDVGIDHTRLTYRFNGANRRLTDVHGKLIPEIMA